MNNTCKYHKCEQPTYRKRKVCKQHHFYFQRKYREWRQKQIQNKICPLCGCKVETDKVNCEACLADIRLKSREAKAKGMCVKCWKRPRKSDIHTSCENCLATEKRRKEKLKRKNECPRCGTPVEDLQWIHCRTCREYFRKLNK